MVVHNGVTRKKTKAFNPAFAHLLNPSSSAMARYFKGPVFRTIKNGIICCSTIVEIVLSIEVCRGIVSLIDTAIVVETKCMDETCDGNIFVFHPLCSRIFDCS